MSRLAMAVEVIRRSRKVTDKPPYPLMLMRHHTVRVLGASAQQPQNILANQGSYPLIGRRGDSLNTARNTP